MKSFYIALIALLATGCQSDISIVDKKETRVVVDSFVQAEPIEELDVLIALDTSGSMNDNFADVANGMELLRSDIEHIALDYQFGYITMDPTNLGYVGPYDSSSSTIDMLMAPHLLPSAGREEGFSATYYFFESEEGKEFSRPEADFLLFLISDEDEQSSISATIFAEWLQEEFAEVRHDVVVVIQVEDSVDCGYIYGVGYAYQELASLYNKSAIDICEKDWSSWLSETSYLTEIKDYIILSEADPILESVVVYVDSEAIYDWEYKSETNSIKIGFLPDQGSLVEVGYKVYI